MKQRIRIFLYLYYVPEHEGNLNNDGRDVAAQGTGAEMTTSGPK